MSAGINTAMILSAYPFPGIPYTHDAGVCLLAPGQVLFASEEERHLRSMHAIGAFPERAAMSAFRQTGVRPEDIGCLVTTSMERCRRRSDYQARLRFAVEQLHLRSDVPSLCVPHHLAHSALAVLTSPFDECLFLTLDGGGDGHMGHWGVFRRGRFRVLESIRYSPAAFFSFVTSLCGFPLFEEGKAMGLAAYGHVDETLLAWFRKHFTIRPDSADLQTGLEMRWHSTLEPEHIDPDSYPRHKYYRWSLDFSDGSDRAWMHEIPPQDIARTGQQVFQELVDTIIGRLRVRTGIRLMACAGGAFLNVAANGHLVRRHPDMTFFYPVAPHDAGLALGAALWTGHTLRWPRPARPVSPLLGPSFTRKEIEGVLAEYGLDGVRLTNTVTAVARAVADGQIVGWFDGPAEYGARALGARSVLADPRRVESKARLNQLLKKRDWFMPYAPSILEERGAEYFEHFTPDPYMNVAIRVRPERAAEIPAAVHRDGTCRVHAVSKSLNPNFHAILVAFEDVTGVPMVLNTSFNRHGLPMVSTPRQAIEHLLQGHVDVLVFDGLAVGAPKSRHAAVQPASEAALLALMSLKRGASLVAKGQVGAARRLLARGASGVSPSEDGLTFEGTPLWTREEPLSSLEHRWLERTASYK